jgi:arsenate reductase
MAEGFLRHYQGDEFEAHSAGTDPKPEVHPLAVRVMREVGIDISRQKPKALTEFLGRLPVAHLIVVCDNANQTCPRVWPGAFTRAYLPFDDPAAFEGTEDETLAGFRRIRDEIGKAMRDWRPQREKSD